MTKGWANLTVMLSMVAGMCGLFLAGPTASAATKATRALAPLAYQFDYLTSLAGDTYAGLVYALDVGYYAKQGLNVSLISGSGSNTTAEDVADGKVNMGDADSGVVAKAIAAGEPIRVVGGWQEVFTYGFFIADSSNATSVKGLVGKTVIVETGSTSATLIDGILEANGVAPSSVNIQTVSTAVALTEYESGTGDAILTVVTGNAPAIQAHRPSKIVWLKDIGFNMPDSDFITSDTFLENHPQEVRGFLTATYKGISGSLHHLANAEADYLKFAPTANAADLSITLPQGGQYLCSSNQAHAHQPVGYPNRKDWAHELLILKKWDALPASISYSQVIDDQFFQGKHPVSSSICPTKY